MLDDKDVKNLDFDKWTEEDENRELEELSKDHRISYVVSEAAFYGRFSDGVVIKTPIVISVNDMEKINNLGSASEIDQLKALLGLLGQGEDLEYLSGCDLFEALDYAQKFFKVFEKVARMSMGEFVS